jgi:hypothetical protein
MGKQKNITTAKTYHHLLFIINIAIITPAKLAKTPLILNSPYSSFNFRFPEQ